MKRRIEIGGGRNPHRKKEGYINIDDNSGPTVDIVRNVLRGLPFDDSSVDEIYMCHVLEHLPNGPDMVFFINELYRVLKNKGILEIIVPHSITPEAFNPLHLSYWNERSFDFFGKDYTKTVEDTGINVNFRLIKKRFPDMRYSRISLYLKFEAIK